jgi:lipid-A-disaccharide synthase
VPARELRLFLIAGEHSGDQLGAKLMAAITNRTQGRVHYRGVGAEAMAREGLEPLFALSDVAVMGPLAILRRLPRIVRRVYQTVDAAIAASPDAVVIIDAPEFTHPIARRIRRRRPAIPIIDYVSPTVWAWRPGRARRMRGYIDHVLALLPFEPAIHERLGGPPCTYVGHPLVERLDEMRSADAQGLAVRLGLDPAKPVLVVLPGSRASEVGRLMQPFGAAIEHLLARGIVPEVVVPALPHVRGLIEAGLASWPLRPHLVEGDRDKHAAFKLARAALAASGTVTLELALAGTPMVVGYKVEALAAAIVRRMLEVDTVAMANLVLGARVFREFIQERCKGELMGHALADAMREGPAREAQLAALREVPRRLLLPAGTPSEAAAEIVLRLAMRADDRRAPRH